MSIEEATEKADDQAHTLLKARALRVVMKGADPAERTLVESFIARVDAASAKRSRLQVVIDALQTPPFYFFFGCLLLLAAFGSNQVGLNSSLTFLVAMLGVAVLLYGTGSQAAGTFGGGAGGEGARKLLEAYRSKAPGDRTDKELDEAVQSMQSSSGSVVANVAIAGGAAVLTAFFGWGVIERYHDIRQVFRDFDQYSLVRVEFCYVTEPDCSNSAAANSFASQPESGAGDLLNEFEDVVYLQTGLGPRAFARSDGQGLEFVVFERDLGANRQIKLVGEYADAEGNIYAIADDYFSMRSESPCIGAAAANPDHCNFVVTVKDALDNDRVPRLVLRAVVDKIRGFQAFEPL